MRRLLTAILFTGLGLVTSAAQTRKPARRPAAPPAPKVEPADLQCPSPLGTGVTTKRLFCDVPIGRTPADGILIRIPPHKGPAILSFDLHNRFTYSEEQVRARKAYARLTATIGILTMDNTLLTREVVQNEFRTAADLFDRVSGGAGPSGVKAVAPTGDEPVRAEIPENVTEVCLLGEKLAVRRADGDELFVAPGRPIALISDVKVEYQPQPKKAPAKKPVPRKAPKRAPVRR